MGLAYHRKIGQAHDTYIPRGKSSKKNNRAFADPGAVLATRDAKILLDGAT
jgi:hypothetical protein